jgi:hypothetical protein
MKDNKNTFDKELKARLNSEELPFDPMAWEMMEEKLDGKSGSVSFWFSMKKYLLAGLALLALSALIYWPIISSNNSEDNLSQIEVIDNNAETPIDRNSTSDTQPTDDLIRKMDAEDTQAISAQTRKTGAGSPLLFEQKEEPRTTTATVVTNRIPEQIENTVNLTQTPSASSSASSATTTLRDTELVNSSANSIQNTSQSSTTKDNSTHLPQGYRSESTVTTFTPRQSLLEAVSINPLSTSRIIDNRIDLVDVEPEIVRPQHQINLSIGAGATQIHIEEAPDPSATPVATAQKEMFLSLSYLYRNKRNLGYEVGAQGLVQNLRIANYFEQGEYGLNEPRYATVGLNAREFRYELFGNVHYFLPLNQRSELDLYAGYYALNPFNLSRGTWASGQSRRLDPRSSTTDLVRSEVSGRDGPFEGGRVKLGLNFNFLTNRLNNVGIGISYMHEIIKDVEGTYAFFRTTDETRVLGNLSTNGSGFKVQFTYGFGLNKAPWKTQISKKEDSGLRSPWYIGVGNYGRGYRQKDGLSRRLFESRSTHANGSFYFGHYIKKKLALELGLGFSQLFYRTRYRLPEDFHESGICLITIPIALRRDIYQSKFITLYAKAIASVDFRITKEAILGDLSSKSVDEEKLLVNAGLAAGIDFRIFQGFHLGLTSNYNLPFRSIATIQQPVLVGGSENEIILEEFSIHNRYLSWGVELKYFFNR